MPRAPRIEFAEAIYHVMNRGDHQESIKGVPCLSRRLSSPPISKRRCSEILEALFGDPRADPGIVDFARMYERTLGVLLCPDEIRGVPSQPETFDCLGSLREPREIENELDALPRLSISTMQNIRGMERYPPVQRAKADHRSPASGDMLAFAHPEYSELAHSPSVSSQYWNRFNASYFNIDSIKPNLRSLKK